MAHRSPQLQQQRLPGPTKRDRSLQEQRLRQGTNSNSTIFYEFKRNGGLRIQKQLGGGGLNLGLNRRPIQSSLTRTLGKQAAATKAKSKAPIPQGGMATTSNPGLPDARGHLPGWIIRSRNLLGH